MCTAPVIQFTVQALSAYLRNTEVTNFFNVQVLPRIGSPRVYLFSRKKIAWSRACRSRNCFLLGGRRWYRLSSGFGLVVWRVSGCSVPSFQVSPPPLLAWPASIAWV